MSMGTLLRYLRGDRQAILDIAGNRHAWWIGLLFVLSAGLAREYDGEDLLHEPWYAALPLGASLVASFALFFLAYGITILKGGASYRRFFPSYVAFLGLFWMTAPLAWLYAVPYEHLLSPANAMRVNLITLGIVSAWRVALMVWVLMVLLRYSLLSSLCLVLLFGDVVALILINMLPVPLIDVMGGIRLAEREAILRNVACAVFQVGFCSLPLWFLGAIVSVIYSKPAWRLAAAESSETAASPPSAASPNAGNLAWLAVGSVLIWAAILPFTQPQQIRKREIEILFRNNQISEALNEMSRHPRSAYPAGWEPPPRRFHIFSHDPLLLRVLEEIARNPPAEWVRDTYLNRLPGMLRNVPLFRESTRKKLIPVLKRIPRGQTVLESIIKNLEEQGRSSLAEEWRKAIKEGDKVTR